MGRSVLRRPYTELEGMRPEGSGGMPTVESGGKMYAKSGLC